MSFTYNHHLFTGNPIINNNYGNFVQNYPIQAFTPEGYGAMVPPLAPMWIPCYRYHAPAQYLPCPSYGLSTAAEQPCSAYCLGQLPTTAPLFLAKAHHESRMSQAKGTMGFDVQDLGSFEAKSRKLIEARSTCKPVACEQVDLTHGDNDGVKPVKPATPKKPMMTGDRELLKARRKRVCSQSRKQKGLPDHGKTQRKESFKKVKMWGKRETDDEKNTGPKRKRKEQEKTKIKNSAETSRPTTKLTLVQYMRESIPVFHKLGPKSPKGGSNDKTGKYLSKPCRTTEPKEACGLVNRSLGVVHIQKDAAQCSPKAFQEDLLCQSGWEPYVDPDHGVDLNGWDFTLASLINHLGSSSMME